MGMAPMRIFGAWCATVVEVILTLATAMVSPTVCAGTEIGRVVAVIDGDTLTVLTAGQQTRIRLAQIDAPERRQAFGKRARQMLLRLAFGKEVGCEVTGTDHFGRQIAACKVQGVDLGAAMVRDGGAWVYRQYASGPMAATYLSAEHDAREARRGLWADAHAVPPWQWRKKTANGGHVATPHPKKGTL